MVLSTEIGFTTPDRITVRGHDLAGDLIGHIDFVDMMFLTALGRTCSAAEKDMVNAILVTITDHGLTPSALSTRLTFTGAPEAPQAAVAAGLLGAGSVFLGAMNDAAVMLQEAAAGLATDADDRALSACADAYVRRRREDGQYFFGFGHNIHVAGDPRVPALREVSVRNGYYGRWWKLAECIGVAIAATGRSLPMNAASATAAMVLAMDLPPTMARGLAIIARCAGLVAHLIEEEQKPVGRDLWALVLRQDPRNVLP